MVADTAQRPWRPRDLSRDGRGAAVAGGALAVAVIVGIALATSVPLGLALAFGIAFAVLVFVDLELAIALWVPLVFLQDVPAFNAAGKAAGAVIAVGWIGAVQTRRGAERAALAFGLHRRGFEVLVLLLVWLALTALWAVDPGRVVGHLWHWLLLALLFLVMATTLTTARGLKLACGAFVAGALVSVALGGLGGAEAGAPEGGRLEGAAGDANILAACLVPAIVIAIALAGSARTAGRRAMLLLAVAPLTLALVATQSRGGMAAALVTLVAAVVVFRRQRAYVAGAALVVLGVAIAAFTAAPGAWERVTRVDGGTGRSELWTVAWRVFEDRPLAGAGLDNFVVVSREYVREPGQLEFVRLIADDPHYVHNTYLQMLAETGVVGLLLFVAFLGASLTAAGRAARSFDALGRTDLATLARAVLVGLVAMVVAAFFLSSEVDKRMWVLLALGPALLAAAQAQAVRPSGVWK